MMVPRMNEIHDIATSLLDDDGSCRDLNFEGVTWNGVGALMEYALGRPLCRARGQRRERSCVAFLRPSAATPGTRLPLGLSETPRTVRGCSSLCRCELAIRRPTLDR